MHGSSARWSRGCRARWHATSATTRWRGDAMRVGEKAGATVNSVLHELGLVTREEWDELELHVAQLEHRLRLVETQPEPLRRVPTD